MKAVENVFDTYTGESVVPDLVDLILSQRRAAKIEALEKVRRISVLGADDRAINAEIARLKGQA